MSLGNTDAAGRDAGKVDRDAKTCVFCDQKALTEKFRLNVLNGVEARYEECDRCGSLQISRVSWLADAYGERAVNIDTGPVQRSFVTCQFIRAMRTVELLKKSACVLDYGTGTGLLVRMLRDQGFDAWGFDRYVTPVDCPGYSVQSLERLASPVDLITLIEVFEHLPDPVALLQELKAQLSADGLILMQTGVYERNRHGPDWWYLATINGQHINFASRQGMEKLADRLGLAVDFLPFGYYLLSLR